MNDAAIEAREPDAADCNRATLLRRMRAMDVCDAMPSERSSGPAGVSELKAAVARYRVAPFNYDALGVVRSGHAFHAVFITASGNAELLRSTLDRRSLVARCILVYGRDTVSEYRLALHEAMLSAFCNGGYSAVLVHLDRLTSRLLQVARAASTFKSEKVT